MERAEVVVVGAGVMGSAAARSLGERRVEAVLLEQFRIGHVRGSSHGPTRIFRLSYPQPDYVRMAVRALDEWRRLEQAAGEDLLVVTGGIDVGATADDCRRSLEQTGIRHEWLGPAEAGERFPDLDLTGIDRVLYQPDAAVAKADRTVAAQVALARRAGVEVREETEVLRLVPRRDAVVVETRSGDVEARVAVVTAGSWAGRLLAQSGLPAPPLQPIQQLVTYYRPREEGPFPDLPTFIEWGGPEIGWYALPPAGEAPGLKMGQHAGGVPVDPRHGPFAADPAWEASHGEWIRRRFPTMDPRPVLAETCLYTVTPDDDFVLDRVGPVVVGSPCSGHGFKFAPLIGEVLADLATGRRPDLPDGRFSLDRRALVGSPADGARRP